ncbi:MAG: sialate O-acetylesterase, partial [Bacteroidota bacterium]
LSVQCDPATAFEFYAPESRLIHLQDPVGYASDSEGFGPAYTGSAWPALAQQYHQLTWDTVVIVQAALGGTPIHPAADLGNGNWSRKGSLWDRSVIKTRQALQLTKTPLSGIVWLQGESDAIGIHSGAMTANDYAVQLTDMIARYREAFGESLPFYIIQIGSYLPEFEEAFSEVRHVQSLIALRDPFTYIVYNDTKNFPKYGYMYDEIHYNQQGLNAIGEEAAAAIYLAELGLDLQRSAFKDLVTSIPEYQDSDQPAANEIFTVFPNPSNGRVNLRFFNRTSAVNVEVVNVQGRVVFQQAIASHQPLMGPLQLDLAGNPPGIYILNVRTNGNEHVGRIVLY